MAIRAGIISLGCPRNALDSEVMLGSLKKSGYEIAAVEAGVDVCIINTCAFIQAAREESIEAILEASRNKRLGKIRYLVVAGCLPQLYKKKLASALPDVDLVMGTNDFAKLPGLILGLPRHKRLCVVSERLDYLYDETSPRQRLTPKHYAYIKISEGCSNFCSYCIIARLRGGFRSRSIGSVVEEARRLSDKGGLKEINLVGQDTTLFGMDRYGKAALPELLCRLSSLRTSVKWIRLLYTHPAHYSDDLISVIAGEERICKYLDLPIQHISDSVLKRMNRQTSKREISALIEKIRRRIPGIVLRTSVIVGFPGETDKDFKELVRFLRRTRFERLGAFLYSREDGTKAASLAGQVPEPVKRRRFDEVMKLQQSISSEANRAMIGSRTECLVDEKLEDDMFLARTRGDAPEIDNGVYISGRGMKVGGIYKARVTDAVEYDLIAEKIARRPS